MKTSKIWALLVIATSSICMPSFAQEMAVLPSYDTSKIEEILGGKSTIKYPHPRDVARFGDVVLRLDLKNRSISGSNKTGSTRAGLIVLASGNTLCAGIAQLGYSCYIFEKINEKIFITFLGEKNTQEWKRIEVQVE